MPNTNTVVLRKSWGSWIVLLPFAFGDWVLWRDYLSGSLAHSLREQSTLPVAVIGSIGTAVFLLWDLYQRLRGDHLEITPEGLVDRASKWKVGLIRWGAMQDCKMTKGSHAVKFDIKLKPDAVILDRSGSPIDTITIYAFSMNAHQERQIHSLEQQAKNHTG